MDNYRKPTVNRYWKRPKPKVYDCNTRDAERFYTESYNLYKSEKEDRNARARSIGMEPTFYDHLRADRPAPRDRSRPPPLPPTSVKTEEGEVKKPLSAHEFVSSYDPAKDAASLEERLSRLKALREELGLPSETQSAGAASGAASRVTTSLSRDTRGNDYESSYKSERSSRANGVGGDESSYSYKSSRNTRPSDDESSYSLKSERTSSFSRPNDETTSSYKSERSSRTSAATNGLSNDDYSFKSERKTDSYKSSPKPDLDLDVSTKTERKTTFKSSPQVERKDYSFGKSEKKSYSSGATSASSSKKTAAAESLDFDDDDLDVMKMMKKMPSSKDILDRISKMDLDD